MYKSIIKTAISFLFFSLAASNCLAQEGDASSEVSDVESSPGMRFNFRGTPWPTVLEMFAESSGLSLIMNTEPEGTLNYYTDNRVYTPSEAIDIMNSVLATKGFTLVRREKMLMVVNVRDGIPPDLLVTIPVEELDNRGKFELTRCIFEVNKVSPVEASEEISKIVGLQGSVEVLAQSKQLLVTGTAGRLRTARDAIQRIDDPDGIGATKLKIVTLKHIAPEDALVVIRQMLGLGEDQNIDPNGSLRLSIDPTGTKILVSAKADEVKRIAEIVELVDLDSDAETGIVEFPQVEVYTITDADPQTVYDVLYTMFEGDESVKLATDPVSGKLIAECTPSQHATVQAVLRQMQKDGRTIDVIPLTYVDPQSAVISINKVFGVIEGEANPKAPIVSADITTGSLLVRATQDQIAEIKSLLDKMGEDGGMLSGTTTGSNVRMLDLTGREAQLVLEQASLIWPTLRGNRIRRVTPSNAVRSSGAITERSSPADSDAPDANAVEETEPSESRDSAAPKTTNPTGEAMLSAPSDTLLAQGPKIEFSEALAQVELESAVDDGDAESGTKDSDDRNSAENSSRQNTPPGADIVVAPGPGGLLVTSQDPEALAEFVELLDMLTTNATSSANKSFTVFYLKHEKAQRAASMLNEILGVSSSGGDGGGSLLGDIAGAALGGGGGDLVGSLLGLGGDDSGTIETTGAFKITPDARLNRLIVEANPVDVALIEELLNVIDRKKSMEVIQTSPTPRIIPIRNTKAETIANILKGSYADRLMGAGGGQQQPRPEDIIRAMTRGRGGQNSGAEETEDVKQNISIEVDVQNNSLIVAAPDDVFDEIRSLVDQLDRSNERTQIVTLKNADPALIRQALATFMGQGSATSGGLTAGGGPTAGGGGSSGAPSSGAAGQPSGQQPNNAAVEAIRAFQQRAQQQGRGGRGAGGRGGGGGRGGNPFGGGGGRGGRGGR